MKITSIFIYFFIFLIIIPSTYAQKKYVVVLDAGHGGKDPGNLGSGYKEKKIVLNVVLQIGKALKKNKNIKVIYTRTTDVFVELHNRAKIANKNNADLFVSIHCDSHISNAYGVSTFVLGLRGNKKNFEIAKRENSVILLEKDYKQNYDYNPNSPQSLIGLSLLQEENLDKSLALASLVQRNFTYKLKRHNRGVKQDNFLVLRNTIMPSILIELGFLTNRKEGRYLNSKKGERQMSKNIAEAVEKYVSQLKLNTVKTNELSTKKSSVEFKVQIASGKNRLPIKSYNFKGLKNIERVKMGSIYIYYYAGSSKYNKVKKSLKIAKRKGYKSAFIVAFKNGKKTSVSKILKIQ